MRQRQAAQQVHAVGQNPSCGHASHAHSRALQQQAAAAAAAAEAAYSSYRDCSDAEVSSLSRSLATNNTSSTSELVRPAANRLYGSNYPAGVPPGAQANSPGQAFARRNGAGVPPSSCSAASCANGQSPLVGSCGAMPSQSVGSCHVGSCQGDRLEVMSSNGSRPSTSDSEVSARGVGLTKQAARVQKINRLSTSTTLSIARAH